jgi:micrococcal nuclease
VTWLVRLVAAAALMAAAGAAVHAIGDRLTSGSTTEQGQRTTAVVAYVVDGDTIRARTPSGEDLGRIRFLGINAPEIPHPGKAGECFGGAATHDLEDQLQAGDRVQLVSDPTQNDRDVYGRLLRYVEADGRDVGLQQIRLGAAAARDGHPEVQRYDAYLDAERQSQEAKEGQWGAC